MRPRISRTDVLRGRFRPAAHPIRPPWAIEEARFVDVCTRCEDCTAVCPENILIVGSGGFPVVDFSAGECTFCGVCVETCKPAALVRGDNPPWDLKAVIADSCLAQRGVECRVCGERCDETAIRFSLAAGRVARPSVDRDRCTGCGACQAPCPVGAIAVTHFEEIAA